MNYNNWLVQTLIPWDSLVLCLCSLFRWKWLIFRCVWGLLVVFISQVFQGFKRKSVCWSSEVVLDVFFVRTRSVQNLGYIVNWHREETYPYKMGACPGDNCCWCYLTWTVYFNYLNCVDSTWTVLCWRTLEVDQQHCSNVTMVIGDIESTTI